MKHDDITKITRSIILVLLLMAWCLPAEAAELSEVRITTVRIEESEGNLTARAGLQIDLDLIKEHFTSGSVTKISYFFALYRKRFLWMDAEEVTRRLDYTVKYDNIKKQFELLVSTGGSSTTLHPETFDQLKAHLTEVSGCVLAPRSSLPPGDYYLQAKARMNSLGDPSFLSSILVFYSFAEFDTPWVNSLPFMVKSP